ncbi:MAG: glutamyl-tRNA reductase [Desulfovibrionaceae bacterium]
MNKSIYLVGLNHRTAAVEIRERYALTSLEDFEPSLLAACPLRECLALSTCNRVEIVGVGAELAADAESADKILADMLAHWAARCGGDPAELAPHAYRLKDMAAVNHLFSVASSLDSMVMGEPQILGQLKDAYRAAVGHGTARVILNRLLHKSFSVAKRVRTETAVASSAVSISYAAVELARKIFGELKGRTAMLIGAGEMAELAAQHLMNNGAARLLIVNRTLARARELAQRMRGEAFEFAALPEVLPQADIVISSTGSPTAILRARDVKDVLKKRKHRAMFFIDIAVPRDIDPDVNALDNVYLYDIDDLKEVVEENLAGRREEALKAQLVVDAETNTFATWLRSLDLQPTITDLGRMSDGIAARELARTLKRLGPVDDATREALETLVRSMGHKLLHEPICYLKRRVRQDGDAEGCVDLVRRIFNLDGQADLGPRPGRGGEAFEGDSDPDDPDHDGLACRPTPTREDR